MWKLNLDELPNIIKGEMVYLGPRLDLDSQNDLISLRVSTSIDQMISEIICWANINGIYDIFMEKKVQLLVASPLEQEYISKSNHLYIKIIINIFSNVLYI